MTIQAGPKPKTIAKGIRFAPDVLAALRAKAKRRGYSAVVNELLRKALAKEAA
jgi:uncharacterized protein (DUF4415 family)